MKALLCALLFSVAALCQSASSTPQVFLFNEATSPLANPSLPWSPCLMVLIVPGVNDSATVAYSVTVEYTKEDGSKGTWIGVAAKPDQLGSSATAVFRYTGTISNIQAEVSPLAKSGENIVAKL